MQLQFEKVKRVVVSTYQAITGGRISRTTFLIRAAILLGLIYVLSIPLTTIFVPSSRTLKDVYTALALGVSVCCLLGLISAYVKRLHDIGVSGWWALVALIALPAGVIWAGSAYTEYRWNLDNTYNTGDLNSILLELSLLPPVLIALWRGEAHENRFGPVPEAVEHISASKFTIAAMVGAAAILIPTSIYAGFFQSGIWVGRGERAPSMPMIDSNSAGRLLAKCWNMRGVGAGTGEGPLSGVYRDGYAGSVFDFVVSDGGQVDIIPAGETFAKAYRADGFQVYSYGLEETDGYVRVGEQSRFMIAAVYDGSQSPDGNVNFTTFSFAKTGEIWPEWQVVMSTGMSLGDSGTNLLMNQSEQARGRLMIGDCVVR